MDVELFEIKSQAEAGDPHAVFQLVQCYAFGIGVPVNDNMVRKYLLELAAFDDKDIYEVCFGTLYKVIAQYYEDIRNYDEAERWYSKAAKYIDTRYKRDYADQLIEEFGLKKYLC